MDTVTPEERSRIMALIKSSGNKSTEEAFIQLLKREKIVGWRRNYPLFGHPDIVFPQCRLAVFLDGCFWHCCPKHCRMPKTNSEYWERKIARNVKRDRRVTRILKQRNWKVIRFWEHDMLEGRGYHIKLSRLKKIVEQGKYSGHKG